MPPSKKRAQSDLPLKEITQKQNKEELIKRLTVRTLIEFLTLHNNVVVLMEYIYALCYSHRQISLF